MGAGLGCATPGTPGLRLRNTHLRGFGETHDAILAFEIQGFGGKRAGMPVCPASHTPGGSVWGAGLVSENVALLVVCQ